MKTIYLLLMMYFCISVSAQDKLFPKTWEGKWTGELMIYPSDAKAKPHAIHMEMTILPIDSNRWTWTIHYKIDNQQSRNYELIAADTAKREWLIDEKNGIVLKQNWIANRLMATFSVMGNIITSNYWLENNQLNIEFYISKLETQDTTGSTDVVVSNHKLSALHKGVLNLVTP